MSNNATLVILFVVGLAGGITLLLLGRGDPAMTTIGTTLLVGGVLPLLKRVVDTDKKVEAIDQKADRIERTADRALGNTQVLRRDLVDKAIKDQNP